ARPAPPHLSLHDALPISSALAELIVMGGAVLTHGNITGVATANLYDDPEAAAIVYQSGAPVVQVGMDVCQKVAISEAHLERLRRSEEHTSELQPLTNLVC